MVLQLTINSTIMSDYSDSLQNDAILEANSIGSMMVSEVKSKAFDNVTRTANVSSRSQLTSTSSLGPESGEVIPANPERVSASQAVFNSQQTFNDVDDYDGYTRIVKTENLGDFTVRDSVCYVLESDPEVSSPSQTWCKMVVVTVSHLNIVIPRAFKSVVVYTKK